MKRPVYFEIGPNMHIVDADRVYYCSYEENVSRVKVTGEKVLKATLRILLKRDQPADNDSLTLSSDDENIMNHIFESFNILKKVLEKPTLDK